MRTWVLLVVSAVLLFSPHPNTFAADRNAPALSRGERRLTGAIHAEALRRHVEALASETLEGRGTPSKGADAAAEFIAARFRACGLVPAGDALYFQTAAFELVTQPAEGLSLSLQADGDSVTVPRADLESRSATSGVAIRQAALYLLDPDQLPASATGETRGRVLVADLAGVQEWTPAQRKSRGLALADPQAVIARAGAVAMIVNRAGKDTPAPPQLREASPAGSPAGAPPVVNVRDDAFRRLVAGWKPGPVPAAAADLSVPASVIEPRTLKNVAGLVRGSDRKLRDTYVVVSAHYDHLGVRDGRIMRGANDDASGVAAMLEIARAVTAGRLRPRRSILFLAFFGEELSGLGSRWYAAHPLVPLASTAGAVNLEQLGRTDDADATRLAELTVTGIDYSDVGAALRQAGPRLGVTVTGREGDRYFEKADNVFLARAGIPAHTVSVTYVFPGRHTAEDTPEKLDYANFELVTRAVSLGVWTLANDAREPRWNAAAAAAKPYLEAREKK